MISIAINFCLTVLAIAGLISIARMIKGPTMFDRVLSFDGLAVSLVGMMVLLSIQWETIIYMDIILVFSLFGFLGTIAFCLYLMKPDEEK